MTARTTSRNTRREDDIGDVCGLGAGAARWLSPVGAWRTAAASAGFGRVFGRAFRKVSVSIEFFSVPGASNADNDAIMRHFIRIASTAILAPLSLLAQAVDSKPVKRVGTELPGVRAAVDRMVNQLDLQAAGLSVVRADVELHRSLHEGMGADTVVPIASASKWLAVATILTLVDDGKLDLDQTVARYVKEFDRDDKRWLTVRQCLSCMSGLPARLGVRMRGWDMDQFAATAGGKPLRAPPASAFLYGGVGFQMVAVAATRVTGKSWHKLFAERIAKPLGMANTQFGSLQPIAGEPGQATLPWVAGGAVSTLNDYTRFVRMLLANGEWRGKRVLAKALVDEMLRDQVDPLIEVKSALISARSVRYGLGTWREELAKDSVRLSDPGAFGFTPWIDPQLAIGGVFAVQDRVGRVLRKLDRVHDAIASAVQSEAVAGTSETVRLRHDSRNRRYHLHVPPHEQNHAGLPLMVVLHGGGGNGAQVRDVTGLHALGVAKGFAVAFPDGTGRLPKKLLTWNSGKVDAYAKRNKVDDVGFLKQVVVDVQKRVSIDSRRIYVVGHSNGGMMCHRLAREAADVFAGIAVVSGAMNFVDTDAASPVAALLIHGSNDQFVSIEGGEAKSVIAKKRVDASLQNAVDYYVERNGLLAYPTKEVADKVRLEQYVRAKGEGAAAPVWVVTLEGGGHAWPGAERGKALLDVPHPWPASRKIVQFFASLTPSQQGRPLTPAVPR